jgi:hypothetical protein
MKKILLILIISATGIVRCSEPSASAGASSSPHSAAFESASASARDNKSEKEALNTKNAKDNKYDAKKSTADLHLSMAIEVSAGDYAKLQRDAAELQKLKNDSYKRWCKRLGNLSVNGAILSSLTGPLVLVSTQGQSGGPKTITIDSNGIRISQIHSTTMTAGVSPCAIFSTGTMIQDLANDK